MLKRFNKFTALVIVMVLALISCAYIGVTSAKYHFGLTGTGEVTSKTFTVSASKTGAIVADNEVIDLSTSSVNTAMFPEPVYFKGWAFRVTDTSEADVVMDVIVRSSSNSFSNNNVLVQLYSMAFAAMQPTSRTANAVTFSGIDCKALSSNPTAVVQIGLKQTAAEQLTEQLVINFSVEIVFRQNV